MSASKYLSYIYSTSTDSTKRCKGDELHAKRCKSETATTEQLATRATKHNLACTPCATDTSCVSPGVAANPQRRVLNSNDFLDYVQTRAFYNETRSPSQRSTDTTDTETTSPAPKLQMLASIPVDLPPVIFITGGGVRFFWKAGYVTYLMYHFDLSRCIFFGTSAGALVGTLACCNINIAWAAKLALHIAIQANVYEKTFFITGLLSSLIEQWLDAVLPQDLNMEDIRSRLIFTAYRISKLRLEGLTNFQDRDDLVDCLLATTHVPFFSNGRGTRKTRQLLYADGGLGGDIATAFGKNLSYEQYIVIRCSETEDTHRKINRRDYICRIQPPGMLELMHQGFAYARHLHTSGRLKALERFQKYPSGTFDSREDTNFMDEKLTNLTFTL